MDQSFDTVSDLDLEETKNDRRMTRVLTNPVVLASDVGSTTSDSDDSSGEKTVAKGEKSEDMIDKVKGMTTEQMRELLDKLDLSGDVEDGEEDDKNENVHQEQDDKQKNNKTQKAQKKGNAKEDKDDKKNKEEIEHIPASKGNKSQKVIKGKKNNTKIDNQKEENLNQFEEKIKPVKSSNTKSGIHGTSKEKQIKSSNKAVNENPKTLSEHNIVENFDNHTEGRVMRSTRARNEKEKKVLKEINEPLIDLDSGTVPTNTIKTKKNARKIDSEIKSVQITKNEISEEEAVDQKKKPKKTVAPDMKKLEDNKVSTVASEEKNPTEVKLPRKKVVTEVKEHQEKPSTIDKEDHPNRKRKNLKKDESENVPNIVQKDKTSAKNTKTKKNITNSKTAEVVSKTAEVVEAPPSTAGKAKLKPKTDQLKNKALVENKENKINEDPAPNKRAPRKK